MNKKRVKKQITLKIEDETYQQFGNYVSKIISLNDLKTATINLLKAILDYYNIDISKISNWDLSKIIKKVTKETNTPLNLLLEISKLGESTYHFNKDKPDYLTEHQNELEDIKTAYNINNGIYGPNGISKYMRSAWGLKIGEKMTKHIMELANLKYRPAKADPYISYKKTAVFSGNRVNLLKRNFKADKPLQKIVTDIKMFRTKFGKAYFQALLDLFNGEILCFRLTENANAIHTIDMIEELHEIYGDKICGATIHTDNGAQYADQRYDDILNKYKLIKSLSRVGNCLDNSPAESLNKAVQIEWFEIYSPLFMNIDEMRYSLLQYVYFYNNFRVKKSNEWMSPYYYKKIWEKQNANY